MNMNELSELLTGYNSGANKLQCYLSVLILLFCCCFSGCKKGGTVISTTNNIGTEKQLIVDKELVKLGVDKRFPAKMDCDFFIGSPPVLVGTKGSNEKLESVSITLDSSTHLDIIFNDESRALQLETSDGSNNTVLLYDYGIDGVWDLKHVRGDKWYWYINFQSSWLVVDDLSDVLPIPKTAHAEKSSFSFDGKTWTKSK